jgi:hypothetical protein
VCERGKFVIRQPPMGKKDDYDSENSWMMMIAFIITLGEIM